MKVEISQIRNTMDRSLFTIYFLWRATGGGLAVNELLPLCGFGLFRSIIDKDNSSGDQHQGTKNGETDRFIEDEPTEDHTEGRGQKAKGGHV